MQGVALYNEQITGPEHAVIVTNRACRAALGDRGVAHLTISKDVQMMKLSADKRSMRNPGARTSSSWLPAAPVPPAAELKAAADILNSGQRVAILAGQGALGAREELTKLADALGAPVANGQGCARGRFAAHDRRHRRSRHRTVLVGDEGMRHGAHSRLDHAMGRILSDAGSGARHSGRPQTGLPWLALSRGDRAGGRHQGTLQGLLPLIQWKSDRSFLNE